MKEKNLTLVVLAAGMGSRFGGLKQIEPIGPNGEFITDYSIYDAMLAGVKKVVFIIKKENLSIFEETIGKRIGDRVEVSYAFQGDTIVSSKGSFTREKPWGTAHAILCCKDLVDGNFMIINSDDFYGRDSYQVATSFYDGEKELHNFGLVGYKVVNTLTENGSVKRGVCEVENGYLKNIIESKVEKEGKDIVARPLNGADSFVVNDSSTVSMNMFLFTPYIFDLLEEQLDDFISSNLDNLDACEYLIPDVVQRGVRDGKVDMQVLPTDAKWEGVTYKEDKDGVVQAIRSLINDGVYQEDLWQKQ